MLSGGGITTLETAIRFPVRLIESGPAGGAIFASHIAHQLELDDVVSYDMGGTTAKLCLIDHGAPQTSRSFEVARVYRFLKGSGIPLRIPVIDMVEIGAGGGSIASIDAMGRIAVGPTSAGSEPGPACYGRGGTQPTVTDADVVLGRIDPAQFAGGRMVLDRPKAETALLAGVGQCLGLDATEAALGVAEMVDENMANASRVHAIESGRVIEARTLVAFGGAAPLHAARLAEKLQMARVVIPPGAGVGSAIGFLRAPIAYEVTRSYYQRLNTLDIDGANALLATMRDEAMSVVAAGAGDRHLVETRTAFMRYVGQGHEVGVELPIRIETPRLGPDAAEVLLAAFEREYHRLYERTISNLAVEILTWVLLVSTEVEHRKTTTPCPAPAEPPPPMGQRHMVDTASGQPYTAPVYARQALQPGMRLPGPAVIVEQDTTTVVSARFSASIHPLGYMILERT
jgi:N-methylhydantoinase A